MGYDNDLSGFVAIDIETMASPDAAAFLDPVRPPANYKDPLKIAAYCEEKQAERIANAGLEADLNEVVAVGWRVLGVPAGTEVATRADATECQLLKAVFEAIGSRIVVGFNSLGFDLPVLIRRAQLLGIPYPELNLDRYRTPHIDVLERLSFHGKLTLRSLKFYGRRFGLPVPDETSGKDIAGLVAAGDWPAIEMHCAADVELTAALAARLGWIR